MGSDSFLVLAQGNRLVAMSVFVVLRAVLEHGILPFTVETTVMANE
jgi:hypothetical protein